MDRFFWRGRVIAPTHAEAVDKLKAQVEAQGYRLKDGVRLKPCPVQPWKDTIWWSTEAEVVFDLWPTAKVAFRRLKTWVEKNMLAIKHLPFKHN